MIVSRAHILAGEENILSTAGNLRTKGWIMDIRRLLLDPVALEDIAIIFESAWPASGHYQVGGLETAGIPLVTGIVVHLHQRSQASISGFFIRKSRKKDGLMKTVEGEIFPNRPIILVDDLMNSGTSFIRQVEILEEMGHSVSAVWSLIRYRDLDYYEYFAKKGITVKSVFTLDDFASRGLKNIRGDRSKHQVPYTLMWKFAAGNPSYQHVVPKSDPAIDEKRLYVGSDDGTMWALDHETGAVVWSKTIGFHKKGKGIFSSPVVSNGVVYFGGYDGNLYALNAETGQRKWVSFEADWIGSSPAIAPELGHVYVGLEFGLWRKHGGIAAVDMHTGKTIWVYKDMPGYTHSSPLYIPEHRQVVIGNNDGSAYLFDAVSGRLLWQYATGMPTEEELGSGFSAYDIKESFAYDASRDVIIFGNKAGALHAVDRKSGTLKYSFQAEFGFISTPLIVGDCVYIGSLDKKLYCIDLDTFTSLWEWNSGARIFASPVLIDGSIYIGSNSGRLTEINAKSGAEISTLTVPERITNRTVYNPVTHHFFVPTFANEIYCFEKEVARL